MKLDSIIEQVADGLDPKKGAELVLSNKFNSSQNPAYRVWLEKTASDLRGALAYSEKNSLDKPRQPQPGATLQSKSMSLQKQVEVLKKVLQRHSHKET